MLYYVFLALACLLIGYRVGVGIERARGVVDGAQKRASETSELDGGDEGAMQSRSKPSWVRRPKP